MFGLSPIVITVVVAVSAGLVGIGIGYLLRFIIALGQKGSMELEIKEMMLEAREEAERIAQEANEQAVDMVRDAQEEAKLIREKAAKTEERLINRENLLDKRQLDIDEERDSLQKLESDLKIALEKNEDLKDRLVEKLSQTAHLSITEAQKELISLVERDFDEDLTVRLHKLELAGKEKLEARARDIIVSTIQRMSTSIDTEIFSTNVNLAEDAIKGKIIGKEGRNIKTFERLTGVELLVDDTPSMVSISSFDPVRRATAKIALENLVKDGRIQPAKIEKAVELAEKEVQKIIREKGEQAAYECGVFGLDAKVLHILGRLYFRTSYGQNVLNHSVEMAHIAGMIAEEVGADVRVAKAGALVHDIGKALDHEVPGTHVEIGRRILQKFNTNPEIIKAMQSHHDEYPHENVEAVIVTVADAISGGRPGARRENVENFIKRLSELESIASSFPGVEKSYALSAGREIRIFVTPEKVSDFEAHELARKIALRIEEDLKYPGEIKVTVIREQKIIEFAR
jgi:ribonucrease Y